MLGQLRVAFAFGVHTVRPNVETLSVQMFQKVAKNLATIILPLNDVFENSPKRAPNIWATFERNFLCQELITVCSHWAHA